MWQFHRIPPPTCGMAGDWSDLPMDLLGEILRCVHVFDRRAFRCVCASWRRAHHAASPKKPGAPLLMLPGDTNHTANFLELSDPAPIPVRVPHGPPIRRRLCVGSSQGWLVTADEKCNMHLLNPVTGEQVPLPPITTLPYVTKTRRRGRRCFRVNPALMSGRPHAPPPPVLSSHSMRGLCMFKKAVLAPRPRRDSFTVVFLQAMFEEMAFAKAGDDKWTPVAAPYGDFDDIITHKGQFFTVSSTGYVEAWGLNADGTALVLNRRVIPAWPTEEEDNMDYKYLAESPSGELLLVLRYVSETKQLYPDRELSTLHVTDEFRVLVLDEVSCEWKRTNNIGEAALFVGVGETLCLPTRDHPELKANCIYFTDDDRIFMTSFPHAPRDIGVYDIRAGAGAVKPLNSLRPWLNWPPPIWFRPSDCC